MYAVGSRCEGDIDAVVDEQRHAASLERLHERAGGFDEHACVRRLVPQLDDRRPPGYSLLDAGDEVATAGVFGADDAVEADIDWVHESLAFARNVSVSRE